MPDGYDKGGIMGEWADYWYGGHCDFGEEFMSPEIELTPSDDDLMTQYDNEIDEYTAEESWS